jgi:urea carboxylase system permease
MTSNAAQAEYDDDDQDLRAMGYEHKLRRGLGASATFAASFALISIVVALATTFGIGWGSAGPTMFWAIAVVFAGQILVSLVFAELAARHPLAGSVYQWSRRLGGERWGWMNGWVYTIAWIIVAPSVALGLQATLVTLSPKFQLIGSGVPASTDPRFASNAVILGLGLFLISTVVNLLGIKAVKWMSYLGLTAELVGIVLFLAVLLTHIHRGPAVLTNSLGTGRGVTFGLFGALLVAAFVPLYQLFGMDEATSLAEETNHPRRVGPASLMRSIVAAGALSLVIVALVAMAVPNIRDSGIAGGGLQYVFTDLAGTGLGDALLIVVAVCIVCAGSGAITLIARLIFSQAREGRYLASSWLTKVNPRTQVPSLAVLLPTLVIVVALVANIANPKIFNAIIGVGVELVYLGYLGVTVPAMRARLAGGLHAEPGLFSIGRSALVVNGAAIVFGLLCVINLAWPRASFYGPAWWQQYSGIYVPVIVIVLGVIHYGLAKQGPRSANTMPAIRTAEIDRILI